MGAALAQGEGGVAGGTITSVIRDRHQAKAAYRLLDCEQVTHQAVISGHGAEVLKAMQEPGDYLLIEDTTAISYPGLKQTQGLGPIGERYTRGLWAHQTLVLKVDWQEHRQTLLGLLDQHVWVRPSVCDEDQRSQNGRGKESNHARQSRSDRESQRWGKALGRAGGPAAGTTWTYVADRESDIYELLQKASRNDWSYVIRASYPRALLAGHEADNLLLAAQTAAVIGQVRVPVAGSKDDMLVELRSTTLSLHGPPRPGGRLPDLTLNVVHARQLDAPSGHEPACWTLLTDLPVQTLGNVNAC